MLNIIITNISTNMSYMSKEKMYINEEKKAMSYVVYTQKPQFN